MKEGRAKRFLAGAEKRARKAKRKFWKGERKKIRGHILNAIASQFFNEGDQRQKKTAEVLASGRSDGAQTNKSAGQENMAELRRALVFLLEDEGRDIAEGKISYIAGLLLSNERRFFAGPSPFAKTTLERRIPKAMPEALAEFDAARKAIK